MAVAAVVAAAARLVVRRVVAVERLVVRVVTVARHARVVQVVAVVAAHVVAAHLHRCSLHIYGAAVAPERNVLSSYNWVPETEGPPFVSAQCYSVIWAALRADGARKCQNVFYFPPEGGAYSISP